MKLYMKLYISPIWLKNIRVFLSPGTVLFALKLLIRVILEPGVRFVQSKASPIFSSISVEGHGDAARRDTALLPGRSPLYR